MPIEIPVNFLRMGSRGYPADFNRSEKEASAKENASNSAIGRGGFTATQLNIGR